ncbi:MAG: endo-1,4-beta-xylanase [Ruminococcus callidus]|nr:endo-1,4-beta-xylanase [Ruminococcus callidus]
MHLKKSILALLLVSATAVQSVPAFEFDIKASAETIVKNDFEVSYGGWYENSDNVRLSVENQNGINASKSMHVSNRQKVSDGISSDKSLYLIGGKNYIYNVNIKTSEADTAYLRISYENNGKINNKVLKSEKTKAGKWTKITSKYKAPADAKNITITVDTATSDDFYIDDVEVTGKGSSLMTAKAATTEKGLKDEFANYFRVGNILNGNTVNNSAITANILKDCNSIECENEMKPDATIVQSQSTDTNIAVSLASAAKIMDFCVNNGIGMRGHTMVWHSQTPEWFFKEGFQNSGAVVSKDKMDVRMESYIKNMFAAIKKQYPTLDLYAYDICNECVSDDSNRTANNGGARVGGFNSGESGWVKVYGDNSFVEKAYTYARKYAPEGCKLFYNDYNEYWDHKRDCIYKTCKSLYDKGLLDGIGMQSHISAEKDGFTGVANYTAALQKYASIGCEVQITELDISLDSGKYSLSEQADKYKAIFKAAMNVNDGNYPGRVTAVCVWGPNDANSWLKAGSDALLYDSSNNPKLAYTELTGMIDKSQWGDGSKYNGGSSGSKDPEPNEYGWYFHDSFDEDECLWSERGSVKMELSGRKPYMGSNSLLCSERTDAWNGVQKELSTRMFVPGKSYSFSSAVGYLDGDCDKADFSMTLQYKDSSDETHYVNIATVTATKGKYAQLANRSFEIPSDAVSMQLVIETSKELVNFYVDEVIGAVDGTGILFKEEEDPTTEPSVEEYIKGDVDGNKCINVIDLSMIKNFAVNGGGNSASDVNDDGKTDITDVVLMQKYVLAIIDKFPSEVKKLDDAEMNNIFSSVNLASGYKKDGENNPVYTQRFGADPGVMEYNGRVYLYTTNDVIEYDSNGKIVENTYAKVNKINCFSSADMVNWEDHGAIEVAGTNGASKWGSNSWAPCSAHKKINGKEQFFLYYANGGNGIGVLTSDSPTGPWKDPLGKALISRATPNCGNVTWLFDPAVMVDDDGTGYLCFGGGVPEGQNANPGTARIVKLGSDMISIEGTPTTIDVPYLFEDSGINKIGDKYYYTYCSNWKTDGNQYGLSGGAIQYMVSDNPMGPYTYGGQLFANQGNFFGLYGNNHHSIVNFKNQLYLFYHARAVESAMGIDGNYRSTQVDKITMSGTKMEAVKGTMTGISQLSTVNPYTTQQAEMMSDQGGIEVNNTGNTTVSCNKGDWIKVSGVDFSKGASKITVKATSKKDTYIKIVSGSKTGKVVGYVKVPANSNGEITYGINNISGKNDIYFIFSDDIEFDSWCFK